MFDIIILILLTLLVVLPLGRGVLRFFLRKDRVSTLDSAVISFGLGAGLLGLIILYIGLIGMLYRWVVIAFLVLPAVLLRKDMRTCINDIGLWIYRLPKLTLSALERILIVFITIVWLFTLIGSLGPLLGNDALSYHMRDPKIFIESHRIIPVPHTRDSLWPFLAQMLFTLGFLLKGPILAKLFHYAFGVASVIGTYILCRRHVTRPNAIFSASVFTLTPAIFTGAAYAYTDLAAVFYTLMAFHTFLIWRDTKKTQWFYISAIFCGFVIGVRIINAVVPGLIMLLYIFGIMTEGKTIRRRLSPLIIFALLITAIGGIWYIRSWVITGNPIYPFKAMLFGANGYPQEYVSYNTATGVGIGIMQFLTIPWLITFYPALFGGESLGAIFLIFLPMLLFTQRPTRPIKYIMFVAVALYGSWFIIGQYVRFLLPAVPFMAVLVAYAYYYICKKDRLISIISTAVVILLFLYSVALSAYHNIDKIPVVFGFEQEGAYLTRHERSYAIATYVNEHLPSESKVLVFGEPSLFYFNRYAALASSIQLEILYNRTMRYDHPLYDYLKSEGYDYVLSVDDMTAGFKAQPRLPVQDLFKDSELSLIKESEFLYRDERFIYRLWKIDRWR